MVAVRETEGSAAFRFRRLEKPEEFRAIEEIQTAAWGLLEEPPVPSPLQRAFQDNGGLVLGAYVDIHLVGFCLGFLGWDGETLYHYSHMTAVRPEYQNHHVGVRLKSGQRDEVLRQGLTEVRWTFDPLQSRNAFVNVRRLGGTPDRYYVHYYGRMGSEVNRDLETDRVRLVWRLRDPRVEERLGGAYPTEEDDRKHWEEATPIIETQVGESGLRVPVSVTEPEAARVHLEVPFDLALHREHEPGNLRTWRHAVRDAFRAALDVGYVVEDFAVVRIDHERRSFYFLKSSGTRPKTGP
ncbi:MAG TPA: GNAT family N-acetyltransferase [Thermoplasmata archaeon]|nr:GNAT family N-acetyltransferase [Thermoplasmata archaeon]